MDIHYFIALQAMTRREDISKQLKDVQSEIEIYERATNRFKEKHYDTVGELYKRRQELQTLYFDLL